MYKAFVQYYIVFFKNFIAVSAGFFSLFKMNIEQTLFSSEKNWPPIAPKLDLDLQHHWSSREMGPNQHLLSDTDCFSVLMLVTLTTFFAPQYT